MAGTGALLRQGISFAKSDIESIRACVRNLLDFLETSPNNHTLLLAQLGLVVRRCAYFGIPQIDSGLYDLGQAISLLRLRLDTPQSEMPRREI